MNLVGRAGLAERWIWYLLLGGSGLEGGSAKFPGGTIKVSDLSACWTGLKVDLQRSDPERALSPRR